MSREEIDQLAAGHELDALIATEVMGETRPESTSYEIWINRVPHYSTDVAEAWLVLEKTKLLEGRLYHGEEWGLALQQNAYGDYVIKHRYGADIVRAATAPLAICRAALKTVIGEKE